MSVVEQPIIEVPSAKGVGAKPRPKCRQRILALGLRPLVYQTPQYGYWDGIAAVYLNRKHTTLSDGMATEMGRMLIEGVWPQYRWVPLLMKGHLRKERPRAFERCYEVP